MSVHTVAHLNFRGAARQALEFYQSVFGGDISIATYGDFGLPEDHEGADHVVFGQVVSNDGFRVMAYDEPRGGVAPAGTTTRENDLTYTSERFFLAVRGESVDEVAGLWAKLVDGASVIAPFGPAAWAPAFGMLTDRFGTTWILDVAAPH